MNFRFAILLLTTASLMNLHSIYAVEINPGDDPLWGEVEEAMKAGRPRTAIERLEPIIRRADAASDHPEAVRARSLKIELETLPQADQPDLKLKRMRAEIDAAPEPMRPVMEAIQAGWMWEFFQNNRWRFGQRTAVETARPQLSDAGQPQRMAAVPGPDDDLMSWDLPRILAAVDAQFARSLEDAETLREIPVATYADLMSPGNVPPEYRPTLYDVVVHHALEFYSAGEQGGSRTIDAFVLTADSPVFASVDDFLAWEPTVSDDRAPLWVATRLYQDLLRFHADDPDPRARLDVNLARLEFANNHAVGAEKSARYRAALERFAAAHADSPVSTRAIHSLAMIRFDEGDLLDAHRLAGEGLARFPDSIGAARCYNLIQQIEAREADIVTERVWTAPWPTIDVHYRNVERVHLRLVEFDFDAFVSSGRGQPENFDEDGLRRLLALPTVKEWSADLPPRTDFQTRTESLPVPTDLAAGSYFLLASHTPDFSQADNRLSVAEVWVSKLAIVTKSDYGNGVLGGLVVDAESGEPLVGATVRGWQQTGRRGEMTEIAAVRTDREGQFRFPAESRNRVLLLASHAGQRLSSMNFLSVASRRGLNRPNKQTQFFTDRAIYRPGQTINYKAICFSFDQRTDDYQTLGGQRATVVFVDANGKEIERLDHRANDYGSFSGSFTAPRDRLTGQMTIRVESGPQGQVGVRVEEYKRPKFEVELAAPKTAAKLDDEVHLVGTATAYTGAQIDGAQVQWRVVREVRYPPWWFWRMWWLPPMPSDRQEIARGTAATDPDGRFDIRFVAVPDRSVSADAEPTFHYRVMADVTDGTGETRSGERSVRVGYTALSAELAVDDWLTVDQPVAIQVRTKSLDGEGQPASGQLRIHSLEQPDRVSRPALSGHRGGPLRGRPQSFSGSRPAPGGPPQPEPPSDPSNPNSWPLGDVVAEAAVSTDGGGHQKLEFDLAAGIYRAVLTTRDRFGKEVTALVPLEVLDPKSRRWAVKLPHRVRVEQASLEPGETFRAVWASGYPTARALVEFEHKGEIIKRFWTEAGRTQRVLELEVTEAMRGGFTVHTTMVRENRAYLESRRIDVPWSNKRLSIAWERFVSKLEPGQRETWTAVISGPDAERAAAEMVATLYDGSLDLFQPHRWMSGFGVFRQDRSSLQSGFENAAKSLQVLRYGWTIRSRDESWNYPRLDWPPSFGGGRMMPMMMRRGGGEAMFGGAIAAEAMEMDAAGMGGGMEMAKSAAAPAAVGDDRAEAAAAGNDGGAADAGPTVDLDGVSARTNLNETAFFFPHATASDDGTIRLEFTMPEALTRWNFLGFAHDRKLRGGLLSDHAITRKDLMVQPNAPRFLREGDLIEFTAKVTNQSPTRQTGQARLSFNDARTGDSLDAALENSVEPKAFDIAAGASASIAWRIRVPDGIGLMTYRVVGSSGRLSDGEEGYLPVLSRRILVTESLPLPIRGPQTKQFRFDRLADSGDSESLRHQSLTVQMASNPSWYAVMALPYLMEYPHQCSEQVFNRLYANSLARHIATSDPKIERIFAQWRGTPALDSPLSKNEDLKSVMLEETPWYRQAESESQSRRNVGILFDQNRLADETSRALQQLVGQQLEDGRWPWFPGGPANDYITLYITTGFGRLRHLGVAVDTAAAVRSLPRLDAWMAEQHRRATSEKPESPPRPLRDSDSADKPVHLTPTIALYLYGRSFFLRDLPVAAEHTVALDFWLDQAKRHWLKIDSLQSQAHLAIALRRLGDAETANRIIVSLRERSVDDEELGMHWPIAADAFWWYRAPIETQAALIEAFDEVAGDAAAVEACQVWLLKQKQTQDWKTTKATADAVYALLLRGTDRLASDRLVEVSLGDSVVRPDDVEVGTGFYEQRILGGDVSPDLGQIAVKKTDPGVAWGSVHWQYFEDIDQVTAHTDTPLKLTKELYVKRNTDSGPVLKRVADAAAGDSATPVRVGDELVVRLVLRVDRDMEYVHLKDHRGSGTEPVNVLSGYRYQDGLGYYESTRDTASHFFIDYLRSGTYVFEYSTRVQLRGRYQTGMANIQCLYAPEFGSHSESIGLIVEE